MLTFGDLLSGIVIETRTKSWLGPYFYSDQIYDTRDIDDPSRTWADGYQSPLNELSRVSVIGIAAGIARMALAVIHTLGHLLAAPLTLNFGHFYHAAKGGAEFLRGAIEAIPFVGRWFAGWFVVNGRWWMIKIYNPESPDSLDRASNLWRSLKELRPTGYVTR